MKGMKSWGCSNCKISDIRCKRQIFTVTISRKRIAQMRVFVESVICIVIYRRQLRKQQADDKQRYKSGLP